MRTLAVCYIVALFVLSVFGNLLLVGKRRTPLTPGSACLSVTLNGLAAGSALYLWSSA